jgi:hypothetical protein
LVEEGLKMDYGKFYHNNVTESVADCGCKIVLSRLKKLDEIKNDPFRWVSFCKDHKPKPKARKFKLKK